eukprot:scaffold7413_cov177-Ochromonas_danica.AAC.2
MPVIKMNTLRAQQRKSAKLQSCSPPEVYADADGLVDFSLTFLPAALQTANRIFVIRILMPPNSVHLLTGGSASPDSLLRNGNGTLGEQNSLLEDGALLLFTSKPLYVVTQRLLVKTDLHTDSADKSSSHVWYKDEGGRDHGIELLIKLVNESDKEVLGLDVPLVIQLLYLSGEVVQKANMLTLIDTGPSTLSQPMNGNNLNGQQGNATNSFGNLLISVDLSKNVLCNNIGSTETIGIEVKSKRTKRLRDGAANNMNGILTNGAAGGPVNGHGLSIPPSSTLPHALSNASLTSFNNVLYAPPPPPPPPTSSNTSNSNLFGNNLNGGLDLDFSPPPSMKKVKLNDKDGLVDDPLSHPLVLEASTSTSTIAPDGSGSTTAIHTEHLHSVVKWTELVLDQLQTMRWKHIGYQSYYAANNNANSNGSNSSSPGNGGNRLINTNQPLYNIVNPNNSIDMLLQYYHDHVYRHLVALAGGSNSGVTNGGGSSSGANIVESNVVSTRPRANSLLDNDLDASILPPPSIGRSTDAFVVGNDGDIEREERRVHYILAVPYHTLFRPKDSSPIVLDQLYFPAFDNQQSLVGLYVELKDDRNATIIHFIPLSTQLINQLDLTPSLAQQLLRRLLTMEEQGDIANQRPNCLADLSVHGGLSVDLLIQAIYSLPKHNYVLEAMKQDALVHYWLSQVAFEDF